MTTLALPSVPAAPRAGFGWIAEILRTLHDRRRTRIALARLDDHILRDIGLTPPPPNPRIDLLKTARAAW